MKKSLKKLVLNTSTRPRIESFPYVSQYESCVIRMSQTETSADSYVAVVAVVHNPEVDRPLGSTCCLRGGYKAAVLLRISF